MKTVFLLPGLSLYRNRRQTQGVVFMILQPTIIGCLIGILVAYNNLKRQRQRQRLWHRLDMPSAEWPAMMKHVAASKKK
jgi:hypothetical protein